jgi:hypothetical protein
MKTTRETIPENAAGQRNTASALNTDEDSAFNPASDPEARENSARPEREIGGPKGPEPTRYGDWEKNGRCIDF